MTYLLEKIYPSPSPESISNDCVSKVQTHTSRICGNCNHSSDNLAESNHITLAVDDTRSLQTINGLLAKFMRREHSPDYRCDNCSVYGNCSEETTITDSKDVIIIQLRVFKFIRELNYSQKIFPTINIDETISLYGDSFKLHGIIYHYGIHLNTGHYTSAVNINGTWFTFDDSVVKNGVSLSCTDEDDIVPYILMYKRTTQINNDDIDDPVHFSVDNSPALTHSICDAESILDQSVVCNDFFV
jgi:ubiquitin C-terminal hydrolase